MSASRISDRTCSKAAVRSARDASPAAGGISGVTSPSCALAIGVNRPTITTTAAVSATPLKKAASVLALIMLLTHSSTKQKTDLFTLPLASPVKEEAKQGVGRFHYWLHSAQSDQARAEIRRLPLP